MTEQTTTVAEPTPQPESRFNARKIVKVSAITAAAVGGALMLKRKLNANADGEFKLTVETDGQS